MKYTLKDFTFSTLKELPRSWRKYFAKSVKGKVYKVLVRSDGFLSMSNTEYEYDTNLPFFDLVKSKGPNIDVLMYGYGIGFVLPFIREHCNRMVIIENSQDVLDLQEIPDDVEIVFGDFRDAEVSGEFDIIFSDTDDAIGYNKNHKLKEGGERLQWMHG